MRKAIVEKLGLPRLECMNYPECNNFSESSTCVHDYSVPFSYFFKLHWSSIECLLSEQSDGDRTVLRVEVVDEHNNI